jgi:hypothetical protein
MSRLISTSDLHNVVTKRKAEYGKLATLVDNIVEDMVKETPTAIRIPKGATNGDVIKAMFPNCEQKENIHNGYFEMYFDGDFGNPSYMRVREYWWNAPYKKEVEE